MHDAREAMGLPPRADRRLVVKLMQTRNPDFLVSTALDAATPSTVLAGFTRDLVLRGLARLGRARMLDQALLARVPALARLCDGDLAPLPPMPHMRTAPRRRVRARRSEWDVDGGRQVIFHLSRGYERDAIIIDVHAAARDGHGGKRGDGVLLQQALWQGLLSLAAAGALSPAVLEAVPELAPGSPAHTQFHDARGPAFDGPAAEPHSLPAGRLDVPKGTRVVETPVDAEPAPAAPAAPVEPDFSLDAMFEMDDMPDNCPPRPPREPEAAPDA